MFFLKVVVTEWVGVRSSVGTDLPPGHWQKESLWSAALCSMDTVNQTTNRKRHTC